MLTKSCSSIYSIRPIYSKVKKFAVMFTLNLLHLTDNTMKLWVYHAVAGFFSVIVLCMCTCIDIFFGPFDCYWSVNLWCDSYSDLPARINEAAEPEEQGDQQGGEPGPQTHPNGHHSGGSGTGAKRTHVGSPMKCWYRIQSVYTLGCSSLSLVHSLDWGWGSCILMCSHVEWAAWI